MCNKVIKMAAISYARLNMEVHEDHVLIRSTDGDHVIDHRLTYEQAAAWAHRVLRLVEPKEG